MAELPKRRARVAPWWHAALAGALVLPVLHVALVFPLKLNRALGGD